MVAKNCIRSSQGIEHFSTESASAYFMMVAKKVSMTERYGFRVAGASGGVQLEAGGWAH
jgi:hypothetical protein